MERQDELTRSYHLRLTLRQWAAVEKESARTGAPFVEVIRRALIKVLPGASAR